VTDRREVNEFRRAKFGGEEDRAVAFVCECADPDCRRAVILTTAEYDAERASTAGAVLYPGHAPAREQLRRAT
jgi:hypothetical protein